MQQTKIKAGIMGAAGYTAGELLRLLLRHPNVEILFAQSGSQAGKPIYDLHKDLLGETDLHFTSGADANAEVIFICSGHGKTQEFLSENPWAEGKVLIDLSNDFRLDRSANGWTYGLPEVYRKNIKTSKKIANPGCFATCIQLALLPLAFAGRLTDEIHINAITGSTGAGAGLAETSHFSWRDSNVSIYKAFTHQHLDEMAMTLDYFKVPSKVKLNFIPVRGNFTRGILATVYTRFDGSLEEAAKLFGDYYSIEPFVRISKINPDLKQVVNTNRAVVYLEKHGDKLLIVSAIDNLLKGASGQAVQNLNILMGWEETLGLQLKASAF